MQTRTLVLYQLVWCLVEILNQTRQGERVPSPLRLLGEADVRVGATTPLFRSIISFFNREFVSIWFQGQIKHINGLCVKMRSRITPRPV